MNDKEVLIKVKGITKWFPVKRSFFEEQQYVKAVDDVSFTLNKGETMGIVGESGCGKSTLARTLLRLIEPTKGEIEYKGQSILGKKQKELSPIRKDMQIIFQDPYNSLHPRMKIGDIIAEPLIISRVMPNKHERDERIKELIKMVGLDESYLERYPHELSGGQRQRIVIARALATNPELVICDEPVSALDVSVRAQILNLLEELQEKLNLTYIFISHDLSVVEHICDSVCIMYLGQIIESGMTKDIFENPIHPYTEALMSAIPVVGKRTNEGRIILEGDIPSPVNPPSGCRFRTRCRYARPQCEEKPIMQEVGKKHFVACHRLNW
ncbi:MAG: dipeptide ABC transporter ATP-binding protein [Clostridiales bacterium]|nr:dipeptide ABC transporter ATP-binding protein [Clostridiales bacterium]